MRLYASDIAADKSIANWKEQALMLIRTHPQKLYGFCFCLELVNVPQQNKLMSLVQICPAKQLEILSP